MSFGMDFDLWTTVIQKWKSKNQTNLSLIGQNILVFDSIDSTNTYIKNNIKNIDNGSIIFARKQLAGKGQKGRKWESNEGGLYFSIKMDVPLDTQPFWVISSIAISICNYLKTLVTDVSIKWPNDVLVSSKKICGILAETVFFKTAISLIIGIGININNSLEKLFENFPELKGKITTLANEIDSINSNIIFGLLTEITNGLENQLQTNPPFNPKNLRATWLDFSHYRNNEILCTTLDDNQEYRGKFHQVTDSGSLNIKLPNGQIMELISGEVKITK